MRQTRTHVWNRSGVRARSSVQYGGRGIVYGGCELFIRANDSGAVGGLFYCTVLQKTDGRHRQQKVMRDEAANSGIR